MKHLLATVATLWTLALPAYAQDTPFNPDSKVYFANLQDGATVASPVTIVFGLSGMG
ncbi:MAG: rod shape-determining protein RodA, partial [Amylibacter sp.]